MFYSLINTTQILFLNSNVHHECFHFTYLISISMISNPLTYAVCLEELGEDLVHKFQGRAPSGRTFNEIALNHQGKFTF